MTGRRRGHDRTLVARVDELEAALIGLLTQLAEEHEARVVELREELRRPAESAADVVDRARRHWSPDR